MSNKYIEVCDGCGHQVSGRDVKVAIGGKEYLLFIRELSETSVIGNFGNIGLVAARPRKLDLCGPCRRNLSRQLED